MYLDWKSIEKLQENSPGSQHLGTLLNSFDPESEVGKRLVEAFPECFTESPMVGEKVAWIALLRDEEEYLELPENKGITYRQELSENGILNKYSIPVLMFSITQENHEEWKFPLLPEAIVRKCYFGAVVTYQEKKYVVVQIESGEVRFSPLEFIDMDH